MTKPANKELDRAFTELSSDLPFFSKNCLKIRTVDARIAPFIFNREQIFLHTRLEAQKKRKGMVRAIILKGRQQGISTYVAARFYQQLNFKEAMRVYILAHELKASDNLFDIVDRYHKHTPVAVKHELETSNAKELLFRGMDSGYTVGTAGSKGTGRSATTQLFHGSEIGYWPNAQEHAAGIMQTVHRVAGTEIILESTANGVGNMFHKMVMNAIRGVGDYEFIFIPWYWHEEYRITPPKDFSLTSEEKEYKTTYKLNNAQMYWRRLKNIDLGDEWLFKREYPANVNEAFETSAEDVFIPSSLVLKARRQESFFHKGPLLFGIDPARFGDNDTGFIHRIGREVTKLKKFSQKDEMELAGLIALEINEYHPFRVFIDVVNIGSGVIDRLRELGYGRLICAVNGAENAIKKERYVNKRAEMWGEMKLWLKDGPVRIPDSDELMSDLISPKRSYDSNSRLKIESKVDMRGRGVPSPDLGDAMAMTFAEPVAYDSVRQNVGAQRMFQAATDWQPF